MSKMKTYMGYEYVDYDHTNEEPETVTTSTDGLYAYGLDFPSEESLSQFDFEQQMMDCWNITSDVDTLYVAVMEESHLTKDNIANILLGMKELYELKFSTLNRMYEELLAQGKF